MSIKTIPVYTGPNEGGNVVEQEYFGVLLVRRFGCAPLRERRMEVI